MMLVGAAMSLAAACASAPDKADPLEPVNRVLYGFNDLLDQYALKPAADVYVLVIPQVIRDCIGNGFANLPYFNVILNDFLQGKWNQGWSDTARFAVNSTIGLAGIFDVATHWGFPAHDNDMGVTLGKWGVGPGPYLVIPLLGPSSLRDTTRPIVIVLATPLTWLNLGPEINIPLSVAGAVDTRSRSDFIVKFRNSAAVDPYVFTREAYLQFREGLIHEGKPPVQQNNIYDEDTDTEPATTQPTTKSAE
jgi:phospholipid-binding lipoprotein MlaA